MKLIMRIGRNQLNSIRSNLMCYVTLTEDELLVPIDVSSAKEK